MNKEQIDKVYTMIDAEALATCLAESDWKEETKNVHVDELYHIYTIAHMNGDIEIKKEVRGFWASQFLQLRTAYMSLIEQFQKSTDAVSETVTNSRRDTDQDRAV